MSAKQYRKKPVVIEAIRYSGRNKEEIIGWVTSFPTPRFDISWSAANNSLYIGTLEGDMRAKPGDYVIRGVAGEFYPCDPEVFAQTYEEVDDEN